MPFQNVVEISHKSQGSCSYLFPSREKEILERLGSARFFDNSKAPIFSLFQCFIIVLMDQRFQIRMR